jgi:branched-chain amino acid transport system ATP-binding protein
MLKLEDIQVYYGYVHAVKGISLYVNENEIVTLIGANGAGKTTTLMAITGTVKVKSGKIKFKGEDITNLYSNEVVKRGISLVPEGRKIFSRLTVRENLELGGFLKTQKEIELNIEKMCTMFPILKERIKQLAGTLSGGEQQMLAIARGLMSNPCILLLDEPSLGLSPIMEQTVFKIIQDIRKNGTTVLLVEQNANMALKISDRGYCLETGKIILEGKSSDLLNNENVRKAYLGE